MTHSVISTPSQSLEGLVRLNCSTGAIPDHTWKGATCPEQEAPFRSGRMGDPSQRPLSPAELQHLEPAPACSGPLPRPSACPPSPSHPSPRCSPWGPVTPAQSLFSQISAGFFCFLCWFLLCHSFISGKLPKKCSIRVGPWFSLVSSLSSLKS